MDFGIKMSKGNANKVNSMFAQMAIKRAKSRNTVYSECVRLSYETTGNLSCGFDAKDIQVWINKYMPNAFDKKGNKII
jgi:hypothetical protein